MTGFDSSMSVGAGIRWSGGYAAIDKLDQVWHNMVVLIELRKT
jgi:hypothetical protein